MKRVLKIEKVRIFRNKNKSLKISLNQRLGEFWLLRSVKLRIVLLKIMIVKGQQAIYEVIEKRKFEQGIKLGIFPLK